MNRFRLIVLALVFVSFVFLSSGGTVAAQEESLPPEMIGVTWNLVSLQDAAGDTQDMTGMGLTIEFNDEGRVSGSTGCNTFGGDYTVGAEQQLSFSPLMTTLRACEPDISDREAAYLLALETVDGFALDGSTGLQITFDGGQGVLSYEAGQPVEEATEPTEEAEQPTEEAEQPTEEAGQPTELPETSGVDAPLVWLTLLGTLCCLAGVGLRWRQSGSSLK